MEAVLIGKIPHIDADAKLGYLADRPIKDRKVFIGDNVRIRSGTIVYQGVHIGHHFQTGHGVILPKIRSKCFR